MNVSLVNYHNLNGGCITFARLKLFCVMNCFKLRHFDYMTVVSNHFYSVKTFLFSSAKPRDFDGMLGSGLPVSMYTTKTPIDKCRFNVNQHKDYFTFSLKD